MGVGPTVLVLRQATGWTFGFLVNKIWSFASDENRTDVDQMFLQPFFCKELKKGDEVSISSEKTFDGKLIQQRYLFIRMLPALPNLKTSRFIRGRTKNTIWQPAESTFKKLFA